MVVPPLLIADTCGKHDSHRALLTLYTYTMTLVSSYWISEASLHAKCNPACYTREASASDACPVDFFVCPGVRKGREPRLMLKSILLWRLPLLLLSFPATMLAGPSSELPRFIDANAVRPVNKGKLTYFAMTTMPRILVLYWSCRRLRCPVHMYRGEAEGSQSWHGYAICVPI